jgi:hypothetical protein
MKVLKKRARIVTFSNANATDCMRQKVASINFPCMPRITDQKLYYNMKSIRCALFIAKNCHNYVQATQKIEFYTNR